MDEMFNYDNLVPSGTSIDALHKAKEGATPGRNDPGEYTGEIFRTVLKNERRGQVMVMTDSGGNWFVIEPGAEAVINSWSPETMLAPYSKIVFERGPQRVANWDAGQNDNAFGKVSAARRAGFRSAVDRAEYSILLNNKDGSPVETITLNGDSSVNVIRGIPRRVPISLADPRIGYQAIVWRRKNIKVPFKGNENYLVDEEIIDRVLVPRRPAELRAIKKAMAKIAYDQARQVADAKFKRIVPVEVEDDAPAEDQTE